MLPILVNLPYLKAYTFGIFLVLAFFWGLFLLWRTIKLTSYSEEEIFDAFFISLLGALFGSRLLYVITHFSQFGFNILKFILVNGYPGLTLYGAIGGGMLLFLIALNRRKISFLSVIDYAIPSLFLSFAIGKLGAFLAGTEPGSKTHFFLHTKYLGLIGERHLTALYESILFFIATYFTYKILFAIRRTVFPKGLNLYIFFFYFPSVYFFLDKLKDNHLYFSGIDVNLFISLVLAFVFGIYIVYLFKKEISQKVDQLKVTFFGHAKSIITKRNRKSAKEINDGGEKSSSENSPPENG